MKIQKLTLLTISLLSLLAGCGKEESSSLPDSTSPNISQKEDSAQLPSADSQAGSNSSSAFPLRSSLLKKYAKNVLLDIIEEEKKEEGYTAYAIEVASKEDTSTAFLKYKGVSYKDASSPVVPTKDELVSRTEWYGKDIDDKKAVYFRTGLDLSNQVTEQGGKYQFTYFVNPFEDRQASLFEKNKEMSNEEKACYDRKRKDAESGEAGLLLTRRRFFGYDHSADATISSFRLYINQDSLLSFERKRAPKEEGSKEEYTYKGTFVSTDPSTFSDKFLSPVKGEEDAKLKSALERIYSAENVKEERTVSSSSNGQDSVLFSAENDTSGHAREGSYLKEDGTGESYSYYKPGTHSYQSYVDYQTKGRYLYGEEQERKQKSLSPLLFDKTAEDVYVLKDREEYSLSGTIADYSKCFDLFLSSASYPLLGLKVTLSDDKTVLEASSERTKQDGTKQPLTIKTTYSSFGSVVPKVDLSQRKMTCEDLTWKDRIGTDEGYSEVIMAIGGEAVLNGIPTYGGTRSKAEILSAPDETRPCGKIGFLVDRSKAESQNGYSISLASAYRRKFTAGGFKVNIDGTKRNQFKATKEVEGNKTLSLSVGFQTMDNSVYLVLIPSIS